MDNMAIEISKDMVSELRITKYLDFPKRSGSVHFRIS
jgi:hypothetical protein